MNKDKKKSVLIVDDETINIEILANILTPEYDVFTENNGQAAIQAAEKYLPEIILLDIIMPEMDGYNVLSILKSNDRTKNIPVIFITGLNNAADEEKGLALGVADYITKPFSPEIIKLRVRYQIKMLEQLHTIEHDIMKHQITEKALEHQNILLRAVNNAASVLLAAENSETFNTSLMEGMEIIGRGVDVDCVEIWQNEERDGELYADLKHCWFSEMGHKIKSDSPISNFPYSISPQWESRLSQGEFIQGPVSGLLREDQEFLSVFKIKTVLVIPIFMQNHLWGFCCIDDCRKERIYTEEEESILRSGCMLLANALLRNEMVEQLKSAEIAKESSKAKSRFLATMSHEIRTPMNSIMGFAELALDMPDNTVLTQIKDYFYKIKDSSKWLLNIVNDILDISKIESGKMELEHIPFDLSEIVSRCQSVILPSVTEKGLNFKVCAESMNGKKLVGDSVRLYQALMNLLSNAVKFTNTGTVELTALIKSSNNGSTAVYFEVKDTGIGMSAVQAEKIFDPFIQADSSTTRKYGGTGLGLTITKNIVALMGGKLQMDSTLDTGSKFSFEVVFDTIDVSDDINGNKLDTIEKPRFDGLVLICDDNPMNQQVICGHLSQVGLKTITAENGKVGVDMVQERMQKGEKPFDLIFMDMFMPVMDGLEAASKIIALNAGTPIVAMTANIMASDLENYREHGMPDCIGKPFTSQELWHVLLKYLTPIKNSIIDNNQGNNDLQMKLKINFYKYNQSFYKEISEAIELNDIKLAHRMAHTLKGNAGMIGKTRLQKIAEEIETLLKNGTIPIPVNKMDILNSELTLVLEELKPLLPELLSPQTLDSEQIKALFKKLESMIKEINPESVNLLDELRAIPGTEELAYQIENYDFEAANESLAALKTGMDGTLTSG